MKVLKKESENGKVYLNNGDSGDSKPNVLVRFKYFCNLGRISVQVKS